MVEQEHRTGPVGRARPGARGSRSSSRNVLVLAAAAALLWLPTSAAADTTVEAELVEQNGSGAGGTASLTALSDGGLKVVIRSRGLVPGQPHAQHIHGSTGGGHFECATVRENDTDGDGFLTNEEAAGEYGSIFFPLTTRGGATPEDGLDLARMPVGDPDGRLDYERTFPAEMVPDDLLEHLASLHVVQHGIDANDNGRYDVEALGVSTFAESLGATDVPEEATNPASCGVVRGAGAAEPAKKGVETGGEPASGLDAPLAAAGAGLLLVSAGLAASVARRARGRRSGG